MEERQYDLIFICRPDTPEPDIDKIISTLEHAATEKGGRIEKTDKWGRKRMAYRVQPLARGILRLHGRSLEPRRSRQGTGAPAEGFRRGHQVYDHSRRRELKRQEKLKKHRERRAARRPRKTAPAGAPAQGGEQAAQAF